MRIKVKYFMLVMTLLCSLGQRQAKLIQCNPKKIMSPINLEMPLPYEKFSPMIHFVLPDNSLALQKVAPNVFRIKANFGYVHFLGVTRQIEEVYFKSPSEHTVQGVKFGMEMQIYVPGDDKEPGIMVSKLFQTGDEDNSDLHMLGFGSGKLKNLEKDEIYSVVNPLSLSSLHGDSEAFINYQGEATAGKCEMVEWVISVETGDIGKDQLKEFMENKGDIKSKIARSSMRVTQNFNDKVKLKLKKRVKNIKLLSKLRNKKKKKGGDIMKRMKKLRKDKKKKKKDKAKKTEKKAREAKKAEQKAKRASSIKSEASHKEEKIKPIKPTKPLKFVNAHHKPMALMSPLKKINKPIQKKLKLKFLNKKSKSKAKKLDEDAKEESHSVEEESSEETASSSTSETNVLQKLVKGVKLKPKPKIVRFNKKHIKSNWIKIKKARHKPKKEHSDQDGKENPQRIKSKNLEKKKSRGRKIDLKFIEKPQGKHTMYKIVETSKKHFIKVPKKAILPWRLTSLKTQAILSKGNSEIILTSPKLFPKPKSEGLQFRAIYFYKDPEDSKRLIPYIVKVPKDYNPAWNSTVMALPVFSDDTHQIGIKHLRRASILESIQEQVKPVEKPKELKKEDKNKKKKICLKWGLKIVIDKEGNPWRGKKCLEWKYITEEKYRTIFEEKDSNLLNSMGSMKWVVKGLSRMIGA